MVSLHAERITPAAVPPTMSWPEVCRQSAALAAVELSALSPAERVVAACLRRGLSNKEIAAELGKSEFTVKHQVSACLAKLGVSSRARLMALLA
jgi:DNA-binding NarL/FixJ family response regulator